MDNTTPKFSQFNPEHPADPCIHYAKYVVVSATLRQANEHSWTLIELSEFRH